MLMSICSFTKDDPLCMTYHPYHFVGEVLLHPVYQPCPPKLSWDMPPSWRAGNKCLGACKEFNAMPGSTTSPLWYWFKLYIFLVYEQNVSFPTSLIFYQYLTCLFLLSSWKYLLSCMSLILLKYQGVENWYNELFL